MAEPPYYLFTTADPNTWVRSIQTGYGDEEITFTNSKAKACKFNCTQASHYLARKDLKQFNLTAYEVNTRVTCKKIDL